MTRRLARVFAFLGVLSALVDGAAFGQDACRAAKLVASDGTAFDNYGKFLAIRGTTVLVGAVWEDVNGPQSGAAYVYDVSLAGSVAEQKLLAADGGSNHLFGHAVTLSDETLVIGAMGHSDVRGAVYVYRRDGTAWTVKQLLQASDSVAGDHFGNAVAIDGDVLLIGAGWDDDNGGQAGAAYVFRFDAQTQLWTEQQKLLASDGTAGAFFGRSVAVCGDVAVVGAIQHPALCKGQPLFGAGAAYVFRFVNRTQAWVEEQQLIASDCNTPDAFGRSVAIAGDLIIVGAEEHDHDGETTGAAYVFRYDEGLKSWVEQQELVPSGGSSGAQFGQSVATDGTTTLVGAWVDNTAGLGLGAAYIFRDEGSGLVQTQQLLPDAGPWSAFFGYSVALDGDRALVGAEGENAQTGAAYLYSGVQGVDADGDGVTDACECPWDLDGSVSVGTADLLALLAAWASAPGGPPDFDGDGSVGTSDLLALLAAWGPCG